MRIFDELVPEDINETESYCLLQIEMMNKKIPNTPYNIQQLWFEHFEISPTEPNKSSVGWNVLEERDLRTEGAEVVRETLPENYSIKIVWNHPRLVPGITFEAHAKGKQAMLWPLKRRRY